MSVIEFKQRPVKGLAPKPTDKPKYYCRQCDGEKFYLCETGEVNCSTCNRFIANLKVQRL